MVKKGTLAEQKLKEEANAKRKTILDNHRNTEKVEYLSREAFKPRWYKFTKELGGRLPVIKRYSYIRLAGTGQIISLGAAVSVGPSWGATVLTLPMLELTLGYNRE